MSDKPQYNLLELPICTTCGTQFGPSEDPSTQPFGCRICADPRQYVRPSGTTYTTLSVLRRTKVYCNKISLLDPENPNIFTIVTEPKFGIGQRCFFIKTPHGNVLWDMITLLDQETTEWIRAQGGLKAIVISHPHYYTTHWWWSVMLESPVYVSKEDQEWLSFPDVANTYRWITTPTMEIVPGITAIKVGGHFPGSLCLHVKNHADHARLFIADTLVTVPSGLGPFENGKPPPGVATYAFMWSIPNMIPLTPLAIRDIVRALEKWEFYSTHGAFVGFDIKGDGVKERMLESARIAIGAMGYNVQVFLP